MTGIWGFDNLDELEAWILNGLKQAKEDVELSLAESSTVSQVFIVDEWGNGTATIGDDPLEIIVVFDTDEFDEPSTITQYDEEIRLITQQFHTLINENELAEPIPEPGEEWFTFFNVRPVAADRVNDALELELTPTNDTIYNLTENRGVQWRDDSNFVEYARIRQEVLERRAEEDQEKQEPSDKRITEDDDEEDDEDTSDEQDDEDGEDEEPETIVEVIEQISISEEEVEIPSGRGTKRIEKREPYEFEIVALTTDTFTSTEFRGLDAAVQLPNEARDIRDELYLNTDFIFIGKAIAGNMFDDEVAAGTFPRTGVYIRNRLKYEGAAYIYELFKDLTYYTGLIREYNNYDLRAGTYQSFRNYMGFLNMISTSDEGPVLVEKLSQPAAASRGLDTLPDHPKKDGVKAPWLEKRTYYDIVEENDDHPAWANAYEYYEENIQESQES